MLERVKSLPEELLDSLIEEASCYILKSCFDVVSFKRLSEPSEFVGILKSTHNKY